MNQPLEGVSVNDRGVRRSLGLKRYLPILLLLFCAAIFIGTAFQPALLDDADATHAIAARSILQRHDWVTLYVNGIRYLEKAPLLYWLVATSYQLVGVTAFAVRLPTMLTVVLLAGVTYWFGRWAYSERVGLYAAAIMGFSIGIFLFTRIMIPEALLTLLLTAGHLCFLLAFLGQGKQKRLYYGFYAAAALAVLTKGLIGAIFAATPVFLFLLLTGNLTKWRQLRLFSGLLVFLAIAAPWHLLAGFQNDHFFWFYFVNEHFLRFIGQRFPKDYNKLPFLPYWLLHLVWLFPWSLGIPLLVKQLPKWRGRRKQASGAEAAGESESTDATVKSQSLITLYLWLWAGVILIFFNLSTSQEYYTFPAYPALALLLGSAFVKAESDRMGQRYLLWMNGLLAATGVIAATVLGVLVWQALHIPEHDLASLLDREVADSEKYTFSMGHALDLTPQAFAALEAPAIAAAIVLSVGFLLAAWFRWRRQHTQTAIAMVLTMGLLFVCANRAQVVFEPILSSKFMADEILQRWQPNAKIVLNEQFEIGSSLAFYTNKQVLVLNGRKTGMEFGSRYPDAPPVFINDQEIRRLWQSGDRIFLYTDVARKDALLNSLGLPVVPVLEKGGKSLLMNRS